MALPQGSDEIASHVLGELKETEYACSSLQPLTGGTANFIFKGSLAKPLLDGTREVLIKHGEDFVALSPDFKLPTLRCRFEEDCLRALQTLPPAVSSVCSVRTPRLFRFGKDTNTQIQEYLPDSLNLKLYALKHYASPTPESLKAQCAEIGHGLGKWLRRFHDWARQPSQVVLRSAIKLNKEMQSLKHMINYSRLVSAAESRPAVLADAKETFVQVAEMAKSEVDDEQNLQVIHGDFWTGNVLLPDRPLVVGQQIPIFIIDWEMCQLGVPALDLGQVIAELYELKLFKGIQAGLWLIEGFAAGYGQIDDATAFRTAIHVGTHLVCFSSVPGWGTHEQVEQVVMAGKEIIVRAWQKDRAWFEGGPLSSLFSA
ncbi:Phosphotransferase enzyme family protein [Pleurostoma richardsiae]|uniref:Phosphotransferase enzyme family protein n=1 Tax=Pleurostoma richardsiae TaxID=41990 RepID=A0AA38RWT1_9PEZI|nr:Phosphotransferase enzyme family protein [Pleurostoma richardsiae]